MKNALALFNYFVLTSLSYASFAQGCSDAGFCTIGNLSHRDADTTALRHKISLMLPLGVGDESVFVFTPAIQYNNNFSHRWAMQVKLTANYASGNLGKVSGPGDLFISGTHTLQNNSEWKTSFTLGTKLPLSLGNLNAEGRSLPMQYQSSLGTIDVIVGASVASEHWQFSAGWQQPVSGINRNNFLPAYWNKADANKYPATNDFDRRADVLLRAGYHFNLEKRLSISTGLLGIYHVAKDTYIDANESITPIAIAGSKGLTLNATLVVLWKINKTSIGFSGGTPLVFRDVRPDGLTRKFVVSPEIHFTF